MSPIFCECYESCTCTYEPSEYKTPMQNISDRSELLNRTIVVPRESKLLARKTVADRANNADDCRMLLEALGLLDLDTLPEPA